jgi:hypothetical protein
MATLVLAFYAEGPSDEHFLPLIIQRTTEQLLVQRGRTIVDVLEPMVLKPSLDREATRAERILAVARRASGYHALVVHADADHATPEHALNERIWPGFELVRQAREAVRHQLVPLIPVQMTEAWLLADPEALRVVVGTNLESHVLGLPDRAHQVESFPDPKQALNQVIQNALANRPRRRRRLDLNTVYEPLARQISLERLEGVPAYRRFVNDMSETLTALNLIQ